MKLPACLLLAALAVAAQPPPPPGAQTRTDISGTISTVALNPQGGPASITVKAADGREWNVLLGSIRYLIDNNFNPKAGQKVTLTAMPRPGGSGLAAVRIALENGQKLQLRDEDGRPLWRGGHHKKGPPDSKGSKGKS